MNDITVDQTRDMLFWKRNVLRANCIQCLVTTRRTYVSLLRIQNHDVRWQLQSTLCDLRDTIAMALDRPAQEVQESHEALAWSPESVVNEALKNDPFQL